MPPTLDDLVPEFAAAAADVLDRCRALGVEMRPNETVRDVFVQARYWRQSRTTQQIQAKIQQLRDGGAPFLADCIHRVGPQQGPPITNAPPGLSWHQWGEALDCFWVVNGAAEWSTTKKVNGVNGYHVYAEAARARQLTAGGFWTSIEDWPHIQQRAAAGPLDVYSLQDIDTVMRTRYGP